MAKSRDSLEVENLYDELYHEGLACWADSYDQMEIDYKNFLGDQWSDDDKILLTEEGRSQYTYNYLMRNINLVTGYQRKNRLGFGIDPQQEDDTALSDVLGDLLIWQAQKSNFYNVFSDGFEEAAITGASMLSFWMDYSKDPINGDIVCDFEPFQSYMIDPHFSKMDMSDCRFFMRRRYVDRDQAKSLLPSATKDIDMLVEGVPDNKYSYMSYSRNRYENTLMAYDEFYLRTTKKVDYLTHRQTGQQIKWKGDKESLKYLLSIDPYWVHTKSFEPSVEYNVLIQNKLMFSGPDPFGIDEYPCVPFFWIWKPQYDDYKYKIQGMIRAARDAQEEYNRTRSTMVDILRSQPNSGWQVEEGAVKNPKDLTKVGQGQIIEMSPGRPLQAAQKIQPAELSQGLVHLSQQLNTDILQIPGLNEEALGVAEQGNTEISGALAKMRTANSITILKSAFDKAEVTQKLAGQKILKMMLVNYTPEKLSQIVGKPIPQIDVDKAMKYDVVVKESMLTDTQKTLSYVQALQAKAAGVNIPDSFVLKQMPIVNKTELMETYQQEAQAAQQAEQRKQSLENELIAANVWEKKGLGAERFSRIAENESLKTAREAEAVKDVNLATLHEVQAAKELTGIDLDNLQKFVGIIKFLKEQEKEDVADIQEETTKPSSPVLASQSRSKSTDLSGGGAEWPR